MALTGDGVFQGLQLIGEIVHDDRHVQHPRILGGLESGMPVH